MEQTSTGPTSERASDSPITFALRFIALLIGLIGLTTVLLGSWRPVIESSDFAADYAIARAWSRGVNPYSDTPSLVLRYTDVPILIDTHPHTSLHPPAAVLLASSFSELPFRTAEFFWTLILAAAIVWSCYAFGKAAGLSSKLSVPLSIAVLALPTTRLALHNGEPNPLILALLVGAWLSLRSKADVRAGILLGIATALKLFPILLLIPLLRMRKRKAALWQIGVAVILSGICDLIIGIHATRTYLSGSRGNIDYWRAAGHNISLISIPFRWLTRNQWFHVASNHHLAATLVSSVLILLCLVAMMKTPALGSGDLFWAAVPWMIMISPLAWVDYLVLVLPLLLLLFRSNDGVYLFFAVAASIAVVMGRPFFVFVVHPISWMRQVFVLGIPLYGVIALGILDLAGTRTPPSDVSGRWRPFYRSLQVRTP
jgi:alpha-1,2-mannosyltransferase